MKEQNPLNHLLSQIGDMIHLIQTKPLPPGEIAPAAIDQLDKLEKAVSKFVEINREALKAVNVDIDAVIAEASRPNSGLQPKDRQLLEKAKRMEKELSKMRLSLSPARARGMKQMRSPEETEKQLIKERRKKFKPLGGSRGWIPS